EEDGVVGGGGGGSNVAESDSVIVLTVEGAGTGVMTTTAVVVVPTGSPITGDKDNAAFDKDGQSSLTSAATAADRGDDADASASSIVMVAASTLSNAPENDEDGTGGKDPAIVAVAGGLVALIAIVALAATTFNIAKAVPMSSTLVDDDVEDPRYGDGDNDCDAYYRLYTAKIPRAPPGQHSPEDVGWIKGDLAFDRLMANASKIKPAKVRFAAADDNEEAKLSREGGGGGLIPQLHCAALAAREANDD
ncbi:hypothetical protein ACHAW5_007557, partial [Stephanodiscus triporus]